MKFVREKEKIFIDLICAIILITPILYYPKILFILLTRDNTIDKLLIPLIIFTIDSGLQIVKLLETFKKR